MTSIHTPPRPHLALRVGITGHRLARLRDADVDLDGVRREVRATLVAIQAAAARIGREYAHVYAGPPILHMISPLAEGADQIAADAALELGYHLHVPLPCMARIYTAGFQSSPQSDGEDSCAAFERLVTRAEAVQVLDASPTAVLDGGAYAAVGRTVLRHSDVVIAVWDAMSAVGTGGTGAVVAQAREWQIPVVLIDPRRPHEWHLDDGPGATPRDDIEAVVGRILVPPSVDGAPAADGDARTSADTGSRADLGGDPSSKRRTRQSRSAAAVAPALIQYLRAQPAGLVGGWFNALVALCAFESPLRYAPARLGRRCIARARANWDATWQQPVPLDHAVSDPISRLVREYFVWADGMADCFGIAHRDASVAPYVLAPLTVIIAVAAQIFLGREHVDQAIQAVVELGILSLNLLFYEAAVRGGYHERWIDYRSLAEELRHLAYLWPLGRPLRSIHLVGEAATEASHFAWVGWYGRAVARQGGLYPSVFTPERLEECRTMLVEHFLRPQCHYHGRTHARFDRVKDRLHATTLWLFRIAWGLAAIDVVFSLFFQRLPPSQTPFSSPFGWGVIAAAMAVVLPYVATGAHGFVSQGDFWNLSRRSERMCQQLEPLMSKIMHSPPTLETLGSFAEDAADTMRDEVLNWRVFVRLKPPALG